VNQRRQGPSIVKRREDIEGCVALIFSSNRGFLDYYRGLFMKLGFAPVTATTSVAALGILRLTIVAFVVVDQGGATFESRRVLERARQTQQHAPVLVITQKPDPHFRHEALALGAVDYLDHPALPDDIVHALLMGEASA
jgi:ActR/RegA family two-component response regulator